MSDGAAEDALKFIDRPGVRWFLGTVVVGGYLRLVKATSRVVVDPPDFWPMVKANWPVIGVSWHGQSNLAYAVIPERKQLALLISNHPDGRMMGAMAKTFGYVTIDGSGASTRQSQGTGGLGAFRNMLRALKSDLTLFATADIPPEPGRNVSLGMIALARRSGRPIVAIATASSRRKVLDRVWDKMQINYPFSTISLAAEGPFYMTDPAVSDETYAADLAKALDRVLAKAFAMADGK